MIYLFYESFQQFDCKRIDASVVLKTDQTSSIFDFHKGYSPYTNLRRRRRFTGKRKQRPLFSQQQVQTMEEEFTKHRYVTEMKRAELASELGLTETQIKTWFQNRRTKWRKEIRDEVATTVAKTQKRWHAQERFSESSISDTEEFSQRKAFDIC